MNDDCIVAAHKVSISFGGAVIHRGIDLCVRSGEVMALVGGSGSGKTTLLRVMLGLERPATGTIRVFGQSLECCGEGERRQIHNRIGVLFQQGALFSALSAFDNVALPLRELKTLPEEVIRAVVRRKLELVEIDAASFHKVPAELSGGMIKRVALARALVLDPELMFLDEPTAGLDPERSHGFVRLIDSLRRTFRLTVLMATHDIDTLVALADRVGVLADQRLLAVGPLWEIIELPHPFIQNFFLGQRQRCAEEAVRAFRGGLAQIRQSA